jgi:alcohol dehydrogenase
VPGHELAGTIVAAGRDVARFRAGERVTVPVVCGCGTCPECASGNHQVCEKQFQPGFTAWGSFAQYVAVDFADTNLVRLPDAFDSITAASLGCRLVTAFRAIVDQGRVGPGEWVAIHGAGGVGLSAVMIASAMGAQVVAIDVAEDKLALARSCGATQCINAKESRDVVAMIKEITQGGAHVSVDALGSPTTSFNSIACLRRRGRHVQVGLMLGEHARASIPMDKVIAHEIEIRGSHVMQAHRYPAMLEMIRSGRLQPQMLIGKIIGLGDAPAALMAMDKFAGTGISVIKL